MFRISPVDSSVLGVFSMNKNTNRPNTGRIRAVCRVRMDGYQAEARSSLRLLEAIALRLIWKASNHMTSSMIAPLATYW